MSVLPPSAPESASERHPVLTGLVVGLLIFALTLCTIVLLALPSVARLFNIAAAPERSWTPPPAPSPIPTDTPTPSAPATLLPYPTPTGGPFTFRQGDTAVNVANTAVNLRKTPGYLDKPASDRIGLVPAGDTVTIIGGPTEMDGLIWWLVDWQGQVGWMAETRAGGGRILAPISPR
ncbi:MAG: SH3 domain-containing protein [Anaerolineae bacterium]|nr:SH3 domain-containing protein [Caldilineales bacterium]MCX7852380.1 SH3 domain-containing protein [Caldilineales bacterium]MDW8268740.1 SH3 domain-containing protein [Anaerolineae bacterium]